MTSIDVRGPGRPPAVTEGTVRLILRRAARGKTHGAIARELNSRGIKTAHGADTWTANSVRGVLKTKHAATVRRQIELVEETRTAITNLP